MTSRERVLAALRGESVDRVPVSFWGHVYHRESTATDLVDHTVERWERWGWDWVKLNPRKHYHVEPWGVRYEYSGVPDQKPRLVSYPVRDIADWNAIGEMPADRGALGEQIEAVRLLRRRLPADVPFVQTIFTPLAILGELTEPPSRLRDHLRTSPERVLGALERVTRTFERFAAATMAAGADGIYLATVDWGCDAFVSRDDLARWSRPFDERVLAAAGRSPFHVLHVCKDRARLFDFAQYPVGAFSWDTTAPNNPSLTEALARLPGAVMGGVSHEGPLLEPDTSAVVAQLRAAFEQTGGRRWLAAPGCSIPPQTPDATLRALREAVDALPSPRSSP